MAVQKLYVCKKKYTGKHRVYEVNEPIPEMELFGNTKVQLEGQKETRIGERTIKASNPILRIYVESTGKKGK